MSGSPACDLVQTNSKLSLLLTSLVRCFGEKHVLNNRYIKMNEFLSNCAFTGKSALYRYMTVLQIMKRIRGLQL